MRAFMKKEWLENIRTGRAVSLVIVFILFGIMSPAFAKLTPWMMNMFAGSLEGSGLTVSVVTVDALTSWTQFYKNFPLALIIFILLCSSSFTGEYQKGTLVPIITKGLPLYKVMLAKSIMLFLLWSVCYALCFGITLAYTAYFWDNRAMSHLGPAALYCWIFGILVLALMIFFSCIARTGTQVLLFTGGSVVLFYALGMIPRISDYMPTRLMDGLPLLQSISTPSDYTAAVICACVLAVLCIGAAIPCIERQAAA